MYVIENDLNKFYTKMRISVGDNEFYANWTDDYNNEGVKIYDTKGKAEFDKKVLEELCGEKDLEIYKVRYQII